MRFEDPQYFFLLWLAPVLMVLFWLFARRRRRLLARFAPLALLARMTDAPRPWVVSLRTVLVLTALALLITALARPQYGKLPVILKREGRDIVFLLDTSLSMLADDIKPDRLTRARFEISSLLDRLGGGSGGDCAFLGRCDAALPADHGLQRSKIVYRRDRY